MIDGKTVHSTFREAEKKIFCYIFLRVQEYLILLMYVYLRFVIFL